MESLDASTPADIEHQPDVVIVGAGPAGLATSHELQRRNIDHVVLERGDQPGFVWKGLYESLVLHTGRHLSHLPDMTIPRSMPVFVPRLAVIDYFQQYARKFDLPIRTGVDVERINRAGGRWRITTNRGEYFPRALVMATGIISNPYIPQLPGRADFEGRIMHSQEYRQLSDVPEGRILVIGAGNSGGEIASELGLAGREVDIAVRSGVNVVPLQLAGIPIQYLSNFLRRLPRPFQIGAIAVVLQFIQWRRGPSPLPPSEFSPMDVMPLIGFHLVDAIKAGQVTLRKGVAQLTKTGAQFIDGTECPYDTVILATGYTAALAPLGDLVRKDAKGFALRTGLVASADHPNLFMVGHNYDTSGALYNIARDAGLAADGIAKVLSKSPA